MAPPTEPVALFTRRTALLASGTFLSVGLGAFVIGRATRPQVRSLGDVVLQQRNGPEVFVNHLKPGDSGFVFYIVRASCSWCALNRLAANSVAAQVAGRYTVVGIAAEGESPPTAEYIFPVYACVGRPRELDPVFETTPTTVVADKRAIPQAIVRGAYLGEERQHVIDLLRVSLADAL